jgi:hypothetical protein
MEESEIETETDRDRNRDRDRDRDRVRYRIEENEQIEGKTETNGRNHSGRVAPLTLISCSRLTASNCTGPFRL